MTFDDRYGNWSVDHNIGNRTLYNTFQVRQLDAQGNLVAPYGQSSRQRSEGARTQISRFEDGGSYVLTVAQFLEDMYYPFRDPATGQATICPGASSAVLSRRGRNAGRKCFRDGQRSAFLRSHGRGISAALRVATPKKDASASAPGPR